MSLIVVTKRLGSASKIHLGKLHLGFLGALVVAAGAGLIYAGFQFGLSQAQPDALLGTLQKDLDRQQYELGVVARETEENMNALAMRLGQLKAHVIRLDALGQRLIQMAGLDKGEFDFQHAPAQGGPEATSNEAGQLIQVTDFLKALDELAGQIEHRSLQLNVLETMLMNRNLQDEVYPAGRPVTRGWVSSYFGYRADPFNGRVAHHDGIDIAGKEGSEIISVAAGVVTWAGRRYGYGNLVEVNHGNGYVTRYAHNRDILVQVGDTVKKAQKLALMGSSGRSTGPHVHFEVIKNGVTVDPIKYVQTARGNNGEQPPEQTAQSEL